MNKEIRLPFWLCFDRSEGDALEGYIWK